MLPLIDPGLSSYASKPKINTDLFRVTQSASADTSATNRARSIDQARGSGPFGPKRVMFSDGLLRDLLAKSPLSATDTGMCLLSI